MFTGIVEEVGAVQSIALSGAGSRIAVTAKTVLEGTRIGDSIAVNGVCLTVTGIGNGSFTADILAETVRRTTFAGLKKGSRVNLERAMPSAGRFGGHIVTGHIDGTGTVVSQSKLHNDTVITVSCIPRLVRHIVEKGSVALDGVSLTVAGVEGATFSVHIIGHTLDNTTIAERRGGDTMNIETDIIAKYVERMLPGKGGVTEDKLKEEGYL
ncbi:MAG TPA: riboflavin synthase [bacterium]|nr:riboflavin synthase [bacterium]